MLKPLPNCQMTKCLTISNIVKVDVYGTLYSMSLYTNNLLMHMITFCKTITQFCVSNFLSERWRKRKNSVYKPQDYKHYSSVPAKKWFPTGFDLFPVTSLQYGRGTCGTLVTLQL